MCREKGEIYSYSSVCFGCNGKLRSEYRGKEGRQQGGEIEGGREGGRKEERKERGHQKLRGKG